MAPLLWVAAAGLLAATFVGHPLGPGEGLRYVIFLRGSLVCTVICLMIVGV